MHGQIINLPLCVCVCVCVCVHHTFCQLAYRSQQIFTVDSLKDAYLRKDVPFGVSIMNNHIWGFKVPKTPHFGGLMCEKFK